MPRITPQQREAAFAEFRERALAVETAEDAVKLIFSMPGPDTAGRPFYTSFRFFWESMRRPNGASDREWGLYRSVTTKLVANGVLKPSALDAFKVRDQ